MRDVQITECECKQQDAFVFSYDCYYNKFQNSKGRRIEYPLRVYTHPSKFNYFSLSLKDSSFHVVFWLAKKDARLISHTRDPDKAKTESKTLIGYLNVEMPASLGGKHEGS